MATKDFKASDHDAYAEEADRLTKVAELAVKTAEGSLKRSDIQRAATACLDAAAMHTRADLSSDRPGLSKHVEQHKRLCAMARAARRLVATAR